MENFDHYFNLKQRILLDIQKLKNYKVIIFLIFLIFLYLYKSIFFNVFLYIFLYIFFFDYILLVTDILFLDILLKRFINLQKYYKYLRKYFFIVFYKYIIIDLSSIVKKKIKNYIRIIKGYLSRGWSEYNFTTLFFFLFNLSKKLFYKLYFGFKRLRRRDKNSIFWKYIYIIYYRERNLKVLFIKFFYSIYDIFCFIYRLHISVLFNFIYIYLLFLVYNLKYICNIILNKFKFIYFKIYYVFYYFIYVIYYKFKFIICYQTKIINLNLLFSYYYLFWNIIQLVIIQFLLSKLVIVFIMIFNKYIYDYKNNYNVIITKFIYLKDYYFFKFCNMFNGYYFLKRDKYLFTMLYKLLHVKRLYQLVISFFIKAKDIIPIYIKYYK